MSPSLPHPIRRISSPSREVFRREFLETQTPVILTGVFEDQPIARVRNEADARALFGWLRIPVATEYLAALASTGEPDTTRSMRLDEYLDLERESPGTHRMCSEQPTPEVLLNSLKLPEYDPFEDAISSFFVGHAGQHAHMHFDGDYRHVLFHQVFGTKRFVFVSPARNHLFPAAGNFAEWSLENFSPEEMERFLAYTGGITCTLGPGETLLIPASIWHFVDYTTTSMSLNLRFGRNAYTRFLAERVHLSKWAQAVAWKLSDASSLTEEQLAHYYRLVETTERSYPSAEARYAALERALEEVTDALYGAEKPLSMRGPDLLRDRYRLQSIANYHSLYADETPQVVAQ